MQRPAAAFLVLVLVGAVGCAKPGTVEPAADPAPVTAPPAAPPPKPTGGQAPAPATPSTITPPALALALADLIGARLTHGDPAFSSFLSLERYGEPLRAVLTAYGQVEEAESVVRSGGVRYTLTLYLTSGEEVRLEVREDQSVVLKGAGGATLRSPELTGALEALTGSLVTFRDDTLAHGLKPDLGEGWVQQPERGPWTGWVNEAQAMQITARAWPGVPLDSEGRWLLPEQYAWEGILDPVRVAVKGAGGLTYTGLRFRPIQGGTGGGFFGTQQIEVAVVGKEGALSLQCNQRTSTEDPVKRQQLQALVDEQCPALLGRFVVDLGDPVDPALAVHQKAELRKDGTLLLPGPGTWLGERGLRQWQIRAGGSAWLLDLERGEIKPSPLIWLESPFPLADGRLVGLKRDRWPGTRHITIVLQDPVKQTEAEMGEIIGEVAAAARSGPSAFAYSLPGPQPDQAGALLQYDWSGRVHQRIAEQGWPVGLLADGRAVAHRGRKLGPLITWRAEAPEAVTPLSPDGVHPYGATISPDGRRLVYFHAEQSTSDYPRVTAIALHDPASGQTVVHRLPELGHVDDITWDEQGRLLFSHRWPQGMAVFRLSPEGELERLTPPGINGTWLGRDGCALLLAGNDGPFRHAPPGCALESGPVDLGRVDRRVGWRPLLAFPASGGLEVLDTRTGKR